MFQKVCIVKYQPVMIISMGKLYSVSYVQVNIYNVCPAAVSIQT